LAVVEPVGVQFLAQQEILEVTQYLLVLHLLVVAAEAVEILTLTQMADLAVVHALMVLILDRALLDREIMAAMEVGFLLMLAEAAAVLVELEVMHQNIVMVQGVAERLVLLLVHLLTMPVADLVEQRVDMLLSLVVPVAVVTALTIVVQPVTE
jgi:hypothetical protein